MMQHPFIAGAGRSATLADMVDETLAAIAERGLNPSDDDDDDDDDGVVDEDGDYSEGGTVRAGHTESGTLRSTKGAAVAAASAGTASHGGTMKPEESSRSVVVMDSTLTAGASEGTYKPEFMEHIHAESQLDTGLGGKHRRRAGWWPGEGSKDIPSAEDLEKLSLDELRRAIADLEPAMQKEIADVRQQYAQRRKPIMAAIAAKTSAS